MNVTGSQKAKYIVVEGSIGVGKSSLARKLATTYGADLLLEKPEDNPFLQRFYESPEHYALPVQLFFLFQRVRQLDEFARQGIRRNGCIGDFMMEKDPLFAQLNLDENEFELYQQAFQSLTLNTRQPDLLVYLQAPVEVLLQRVKKRQIGYELDIDPDYLERLSELYTNFFYRYTSSALLIVNAAEINFVDNEAHYKTLVEHIDRIDAGKHFFNPLA